MEKRENLKDKIADITIVMMLFIFMCVVSMQLKGQSTPYPQFPNPSLEDNSGVSVVPWGYSKCTVGGPSSPDIQPGIWNVFLQP